MSSKDGPLLDLEAYNGSSLPPPPGTFDMFAVAAARSSKKPPRLASGCANAVEKADGDDNGSSPRPPWSGGCCARGEDEACGDDSGAKLFGP